MTELTTLPTPDFIKHLITQQLVCEHIELTGDGQHFYATLVSLEFEGLRLIARHQKVYATLGDYMKTYIHALSMKTFTPNEWAVLKNH